MKNGIKKICVYGIGGVGGFFGGRMALNASRMENQDIEVYFVARGKHLEKIKNNGLILNSDEQGNVICRPKLASDKLSELPKSDLIFLCVKSYDLEGALKEISPSVTEDTVIIPLLNGVDIYPRVRNIINKGIVLPACVYVASYIKEPGTVTFSGKGGLVVFGKDPQNPDYLQQELLDLLKKMSVNYRWFDNPFPAIWEKYIFVASFALVTARCGKTFREVVADESLRQQVSDIMSEIKNIAACEGIVLPENIFEKSLAVAEGLPNEAKSSFQRDVEQNSIKNEGDIFGETIIRLGEKCRVPTPVTKEIYSFIKERISNSR